MSYYSLTELNRQLANLVRIGRIVELDPATARVRVAVAGLTTTWLPWGAGRAGKTRQWSPPQVGEQVIVASPYGDTAQAFVLGSLYQEDHPAPADSADVEAIEYPDGAREEYDSAAHSYQLTVPAGGSIKLVVGGSSLEITSDGIKLLAPRIDLNE